MACNCCEIMNEAFGKDDARADMKQYRKHGPEEQTRLILEGIRSLGIKEADLLDIGGGIGVIHHELLEDCVRHAIHVDASSAYLKEAEEEAARRGHAGRVQFVHADFTEAAASLPKCDIVTLDRVVCCYPDFHGLLKAAAEHSASALALTYPRQTWYLRIAFSLTNFFQRVRKDPFRIFLHPVFEMDELLKQEGFRKIFLRRLFVWEAGLYQRMT
jgi:2-polyprenyl-3-methyl-5-hydroxy-6-metoxy-1,4-benzoquinol methylase